MKVLFFRPESDGEDTYNFNTAINGIEIINIPLFKVECIQYNLPEDVEMFDALAFTSRNAVRCFKDVNLIKDLKVYAIGDETAISIKERFGICPIVPKKFTSMELAEKILRDGVRTLIAVRSKLANNDMRKTLENKIRYIEVYDYDLSTIYNNIELAGKLISNCEVDGIAITSSSIARVIAKYINKECMTKIFSIGPVTSRVLIEIVGEAKIIESKTHSISGILETIVKVMGNNG
ncbi:uroporphyrinogen III synthase [Sulfolobus sp. A20-N-G8]|nr:uroporphyrinogen III synthase [Sulfolobus sp. A20-N-G8]